MASQSTVPFELIPSDLLPKTEVFDAGLNTSPNRLYDRDISDIFPVNSPKDLAGELGLYNQGMPNASPIRGPVMDLVMTHTKYSLQSQQPEYKGQESVVRAKKAASLQKHIGLCIAGAYESVLSRTGSPTTAVQAIKTHIEYKDETSLTDYQAELDYRIQLLALLDRPISESKISASGRMINGVPVFPSFSRRSDSSNSSQLSEAMRTHSVKFTQEQIAIIRQRMVRLRFEYMSARVITHILDKAVA